MKLPLLAAVEVKRGPGSLTTLSKIVKDTNNLEALYSNEVLGKPTLYFLEWIDHEAGTHKNDRERYQATRSYLKAWCEKAPHHRAMVIDRDKVGFAYGA